MKHLFVALLLLTRCALAGESCLTVTYQPLDGLGSGAIHISQVSCHDWYSHSGQATQIGLISTPNIPPTNNPKEATENLNLASVCHLHFGASDPGDPKASLSLTLDATRFSVPKRFDHGRENIVRAALECLRRCLPDQLKKVPITLRCTEADKPWLNVIVTEFNAHDRTKVYFTPPN